MDSKRKQLGIDAISLTIIVSNILLFIFYHLAGTVNPVHRPEKVMSWLAVIGVFPLDFYSAYLRETWLAQLAWIMTIVSCAFGIKRHNRLARDVFIVLNIINASILVMLVVMKFGQGYQGLLDTFFKLYFSLVASGTYVGFLTIPEVRETFTISFDGVLVHWLAFKTSFKKDNRSDPRGYYNLAQAYLRLNRTQAAIAVLEKAIALNPDDDRSFFSMGMACSRLKKYSEAIRAFKEALRINPIYAEAYFHLGVIYRLEGCVDQATELFEKASHAKPDDPDVLLNLAQSYAESGRDDEALEAYRRALQLNPANAAGYYENGKVLARRERYDEAQESFKKSVRLDTSFQPAFLELGETALALGQFKEAVRAFRDVLRLDENNTRAHARLGFAYVQLSDLDSARRQFYRLKSLDPDLAANLELLIKSSSSDKNPLEL